MPSELRFITWMRFFKQNCIVKWVIFSASFFWYWDFLLENLKLKRHSDDICNIWTNIKKLYTQNNVFKKRFPNMILRIIYILVQISFLGTALGRFSQCFLSLANDGDQYFYSAPATSRQEKPSYGPAAINVLLCEYNLL